MQTVPKPGHTRLAKLCCWATSGSEFCQYFITQLNPVFSSFQQRHSRTLLGHHTEKLNPLSRSQGIAVLFLFHHLYWTSLIVCFGAAQPLLSHISVSRDTSSGKSGRSLLPPKPVPVKEQNRMKVPWEPAVCPHMPSLENCQVDAL